MAYNNSVLVGNWSEERLKNEYEFKLFLRKRDRRELLLQRSRNLFSKLLCERPLAISGTFVLYGFNVQLVASDIPGLYHYIKPRKIQPLDSDARHYELDLIWDMPSKEVTWKSSGLIQLSSFRCRNNWLDSRAISRIKTLADGKIQYKLALSSLVSDRQVDYMQNINDGCLMTLSPITTPCCRNTFVILSAKDVAMNGNKMNYGDEFFLRAVNYGEPDATPLYVRYTPEAIPGPPDRMPIRLSATLDTNCRWTTTPLLPCDRLEGLGSPVKTGAKLLVKNCIADKNLSVMNQNWMQTFFGPECGVTCRNYVDIHKRNTAENIFTLVSDIETKSNG